MTIQELLSTMTVFVITGAETTATLLSGVTYFLLTHPPTLSKLQAEIRNAFKSEDEITIVSVNRLEYMFTVLNEALRLYPPSPGSFKRVTPPSGCYIAGRFVTGNTSVAVIQWSANHSAANFVRVNEFIPERWMEEEEFKNDKRKVAQPFSVGPRNCIGQNLAFAEMRLILARLVWNFDMEHTEESRGWMMKDQKIWFTFEKRPMMVHLKPVAGG
jgi:cytochrome P450